MDRPRLREEWRARAAEHGLGVRELEELVDYWSPVARDPLEPGRLAARLFGCEGLTEKQTTFTLPEESRRGLAPAGVHQACVGQRHALAVVVDEPPRGDRIAAGSPVVIASCYASTMTQPVGAAAADRCQGPDAKVNSPTGVFMSVWIWAGVRAVL